jgi:hypothetical protein
MAPVSISHFCVDKRNSQIEQQLVYRYFDGIVSQMSPIGDVYLVVFPGLNKIPTTAPIIERIIDPPCYNDV